MAEVYYHHVTVGVAARKVSAASALRQRLPLSPSLAPTQLDINSIYETCKSSASVYRFEKSLASPVSL